MLAANHLAARFFGVRLLDADLAGQVDIEQMNFAILGQQVAGRTEQQAGVIGALFGRLLQERAGQQMDAQAAGQLGQTLRGRTGDGFELG